MNELGEILISKSQIERKIRQLAKRISRDYKKELITITVLRSALIFSKNLRNEIKKISDLRIINHDIQLSSYGKSTKKKSRKIAVKQPIKADIKNKKVLVIEDIADTRYTLSFLKSYLLKKKKADSVKICSLTNKPSRKIVRKIRIHYLGFNVPNKFIVGYGIDFLGKYRNLPYISYIEEK
jgi:hypoxanthine phosphoribosyltransferase